MYKTLSICLVLMTFLVGSPSTLAESPNVALHATVVLQGSPFFYTVEPQWPGGSPAAAATVTDGAFFAPSTPWYEGPVWWDTRQGPGQYVEIQLDNTYIIESLIIQVDDNDWYFLYYWDVDTLTWELAWHISAVGGWGMQTRPNPVDNTERFLLPDAITTNAFKLEGDERDGFGDLFFSVSEIQAFGYPETVHDCVGFEPPMDKPVGVKKKNKVLPLKMVCFDEYGNELTDLDLAASPIVSVEFTGGAPTDPADEDFLSTGQGDEGNQFVYSGSKWQFNLQTKNFSGSGTYTITAVSGDPSEYVIVPVPTATFTID